MYVIKNTKQKINKLMNIKCGDHSYILSN